MNADTFLERQAKLCQALGNASRLQILHTLQNSPLCVGDLAKTVGLRQAALSRHLAILRNQGIVIAQHQGQENVYHVTHLKYMVICNLLQDVISEQVAHQSEIVQALPDKF
jgi:ArsR family transcriptional regulator